MILDLLNYKFSFWILIISSTAGILLLFQIIYHIVVYGSFLSFCKKQKKQQLNKNTETSEQKGVSVVIVTNNNGDALRDSLLQVLEQEYPMFEVVVVNENSSDDTEFILYVLQQNYPNLNVIKLGESANKFEGSKYSQAIGIRSAKYDTILLTDVSCTPKSYNWLKKMMEPINKDNRKKIITGICLREPSKGLANKLEQYDMATSYMNLLSYTLLGNAYTSCGMNMCYNKALFMHNNGFISQYANSCNQEDYFVHRFSSKSNSTIVTDKESIVYLPKYSSFGSFYRTKLATCFSHKNLAIKDKILLALLPISSFLFYILLALLFIFGFPWQYIVPTCVIKWIIQIIYYKKCMTKLDIKKNWLFVPLQEIFFFFFNFIIRVRVLFYHKKQKKIRWAD